MVLLRPSLTYFISFVLYTVVKNEESYYRILTRLRTHPTQCNLTFDPQVIAADFEMTFLNAARNLLPHANFHGNPFNKLTLYYFLTKMSLFYQRCALLGVIGKGAFRTFFIEKRNETRAPKAIKAISKAQIFRNNDHA